MTQVEFIKNFNAFPAKDRLVLAKKIQLQMADELFEELDAELPDVEISTAEIQKEIKAFRNAQKKKN
ncbi:hypothetical protein [Runella limosa]|uniref:hypothetical protein n=1 Tax=Runella limosa TaxID=370978 RepID=UPI00048D653F|nr:hypothetical protein [Runella limosa]